MRHYIKSIFLYDYNLFVDQWSYTATQKTGLQNPARVILLKDAMQSIFLSANFLFVIFLSQFRFMPSIRPLFGYGSAYEYKSLQFVALVQWSKVTLTAKIFSFFMEQGFVPVLTRDGHWFLTWGRTTKYTTTYPISLRYILNPFPSRFSNRYHLFIGKT